MKPEFPKWEVDLLFVVCPIIIWWLLCFFLNDYVFPSILFFILFGAISVRAVLRRLDKIIRLLSEKEEAAEDSSDGE